MLEVFKYAASFYVTTLQRAADKTQLPNMVLYLKSYLNMSSECSRWFLSEFVNLDLIRENILENSVKFMRCLISGLLWCAMLKVYEEEKDQLNDFWTDLSEQQIKKESEPAKPLRQTVLGSFILCLLYLLPDLRKYSSHQSQYLQLIARFSTMGPEARRFLLHAGSLGKMLNLFYGTQSPYHKDFIAAPRLPFELNAQPEMGLPTPEDPNAKKTNFALLKEQQRMKSFQSDDPNYNNLLIVIGNLARTLRVSEDSSNQTPYAEEDSGFTLTEEENLLFLPQAEFI